MMRKKDRVAIVSSYGNPLAINVWLKFYEKYWMDVVDKVYIVAGGDLNFVQNKLIEANIKLCDHYNKKTNTNKLTFVYGNDSSQRETLSSHAHLLLTGTKYASMKHDDATLFYVDDDMYILDKNYLDECFSKMESGEYSYGGQLTPRPCFDEKSQILGWFAFCDLKTTKYLMDQYESSLNQFFSDYDISREYYKMVTGEYSQNDPKLEELCRVTHMFIGYVHQYSNIFGNMNYVAGVKFDFINYTIPSAQCDEVYWLFSKMLREYCGRDKEYDLTDKPHIIQYMYVHPHICFQDQINEMINRNPKVYHISGNYRQYVFCYKRSFEDICKELYKFDISEHVNYKLMTLLKLCLDYWDHHDIDTGDILTNVKNYYDYVYTIPDLPDLLSKEKTEAIADIIKRRLL